VMSMFAAWPGRHPIRPDLPVGPGLNATFMARCGWLDTTRAAPPGQVALRPLHRRDLPGPLYANVGGYYVEYRPSCRWDTGFSSIVLLHYLANNTSYLVAELYAGSQFTWGGLSPFESSGSIQVDAIDDAAETATITTSYTPARPIPVAGPDWSLFGGELVDGSGIVIVGGRIIRIPPHSPAFRLVEAAAALANVDDTQLPLALKTAAHAEIYSQIVSAFGEVHEHITSVKSPLDHISQEELRSFHNRDTT
jgi:hypothetical protein